MYTVSAAVRISDETGAVDRRTVPFFGCPRLYSDTSVSSDPKYVQERFQESDLLPILAVATAAPSLQKAFDAIFGAHQPQDPSLAGNAFNQSIQLS